MKIYITSKFLHKLTHYMMTDCWLNYKFNTWKFQAHTWGEHVVYRNCFWHSEQFLYTTCFHMFCKKKSFWQRFTCNRVQNYNFRLKMKVKNGLEKFFWNLSIRKTIFYLLQKRVQNYIFSNKITIFPHWGISKYFFLDHFSPSLLGQKLYFWTKIPLWG